MKVNELTGELIEEQTDSINHDIAKVEVGALITDEVYEMFESFAIAQARIENWENANKKQIMEIMKRTLTKSIKTDYVEITYIPASKRKSVDVEKLKSAGLYNDYLKESPVNESLRIKFK